MLLSAANFLTVSCPSADMGGWVISLLALATAVCEFLPGLLDRTEDNSAHLFIRAFR
jgi:hypothetical protein